MRPDALLSQIKPLNEHTLRSGVTIDSLLPALSLARTDAQLDKGMGNEKNTNGVKGRANILDAGKCENNDTTGNI